jgi:dihydroneopterin aldolase
MNSEMEIHIKKAKFYGYHGVDAGEDVLGGAFEVSVTVTYNPTNTPVNNLDDTIDYTRVLDLVKARMTKPTLLLETLATEIASEIIAKFQNATVATISIFKLHPPIINFEGSVGVTFTIKRN